MSCMNHPQYCPTFTADEVRAAEAPLLAAQQEPDQLMRSAARAVAEVASCMVAAPARVLLLVGPGGNGGDALYAGAMLLEHGFLVDALLTAGSAHPRAWEAFVKAGGVGVEKQGAGYALVIDGIAGIGGRAGLDTSYVVPGAQVLAIDVPSGVVADTGVAGPHAIEADVTVTFGGWRRAHAVAPECGVQLLARIGLPGAALEMTGRPSAVTANRVVVPGLPAGRPTSVEALAPLRVASLEPGARDDKYTGGVVGVRAGSAAYPGAALLSVSGAVAASPAMVRYAGQHALEVVRAHPEVVVTDALEAAGRVQAWVVGPGAGVDGRARDELEWVLGQQVAVLVDADGLSLLARSPKLCEQLVSREHPTVLTPHAGEFTRLWEAVMPDPEPAPLVATRLLAQRLHAVVLRKGRATIISDGRATQVVDAGHSWAATPGSGDVLAGVCGARLAHAAAKELHTFDAVVESVAVHAQAAWLAAQTAFGPAQTSASEIAGQVRAASALLAAAPTR